MHNQKIQRTIHCVLFVLKKPSIKTTQQIAADFGRYAL